jgi:hypothetical protein
VHILWEVSNPAAPTQEVTMTHCPECHRPAAGAAFYTTANYLRCSLGHVFPAQTEDEAR